MNCNLNDLIAFNEKNNEDEHDAIKGYFEFLAMAEEFHKNGILSSKHYDYILDNINEIVSDEMNHGQRLDKITIILSGIQPAED